MNVSCADCFEDHGPPAPGDRIVPIVIIDGRSLCVDHAQARTARSTADAMFGYQRGQAAPPTDAQRHLAREFLAGRLVDGTRPLPTAAYTLAQEIADR